MLYHVGATIHGPNSYKTGQLAEGRGAQLVHGLGFGIWNFQNAFDGAGHKKEIVRFEPTADPVRPSLAPTLYGTFR